MPTRTPRAAVQVQLQYQQGTAEMVATRTAGESAAAAEAGKSGKRKR